jgi:hypothetical protein
MLMKGSLGMGTAHGTGSRLTRAKQGVEHCTLKRRLEGKHVNGMYPPRAVLASSIILVEQAA